jgi:hypothetical protein
MGFASRMVRKSVRRATPRTVRRAMNPVGTIKSAVTPRPLKQLSRTLYTVTNPLGAAENAVIGAALYPGRGRRRTAGQPRRSTSTQYVSGTGVRAQAAVEVHDRLAHLMAVQRERFAASTRPIVATPQRANLATAARAEWRRRKGEIRPWRLTARRALRADVQSWAQQHVESTFQDGCRARDDQQALADTWWSALIEGREPVVTAALLAAFEDNPAPVAVVKAEGTAAQLVLVVPPLSVLPAKKAHVTPSGRLSSKAWTKTELNAVYVSLIGAHLLATLREAFAVAPSLQSVRVLGSRFEDDGTQATLFDVTCDRTRAMSGDDETGQALLEDSPRGIRTRGRAGEVQAWPD